MKSLFNIRIIGAMLIALAGVSIWSGLSRTHQAQAANSNRPQAPDFVATQSQWLNTQGKSLSLRSRQGKVTIIQFFSLQSAECKANLPAYKKWATQWQKQGVEVVGIQIPEGDAERDVRNVALYARENGLNFPILADLSGANWNRWKKSVCPTIYVVDGDGEIRYKWVGELESRGAKGTAHVEQQVAMILAEPAAPRKIVKSEAEWKRELPSFTFEVLRHAETERPYSGDLWDNHAKGIYHCAGCGLELFSSNTKFESNTGWPSFYQPLSQKVVEEKEDYSMGTSRIEVVCARCEGHLGHVFDDGPRPTGLRYCMNSAALTFEKADR